MLDLEIKNFQSIKNLKYSFSNHFYTISGRSNIGKSAIRRAVTALLENSLNKEFIRVGATKCEIKVNNVKRIRSNKENKYIVADKEFDKVGNQPFQYLPDSMKPFVYDGGEENLLAIPQYKPFFLVDENKQTQTKIFKSIFGVDRLAEAVKLMKRDKLINTRKINELTEEINKHKLIIKRKQDLYKKYEKAVEIETKINNLYDLIELKDKVNRQTRQITKINSIIHSINKLIHLSDTLYLMNQADNLSDLIQKGQERIKLLSDMEAVLNKKQQLIEASELFNQLSGLNDKINYLTKIVSLLSKEDLFFKFENMVSYINSLNAFRMQEKYQRELQRVISLLTSLIRLKVYVAVKSKINSINNSIINMKQSLSEVDSQIKENNICPCCGQPIHNIKESDNE